MSALPQVYNKICPGEKVFARTENGAFYSTSASTLTLIHQCQDEKKNKKNAQILPNCLERVFICSDCSHFSAFFQIFKAAPNLLSGNWAQLSDHFCLIFWIIFGSLVISGSKKP